MASPHPQYAQPGPSAQPYYPPPGPLQSAFGSNPAYQFPHQQPPNVRVVNGVGRGGYHHQGLPRGGAAYHPHYPPQPWQPGPYPRIDYQLHIHPHIPSYQHHINGGPMHMTRTPNSPNRPLQFIHPNAPRHSIGPFSPSFHPHPHTSPGHSPSTLPKQLFMPLTQSPLHHPLPLKPTHVPPEPPPPPSPPQEVGPQSPAPVSSSSARRTPSPVAQSPSPAHKSSSNPPTIPLADTPSSPPLSPDLPLLLQTEPSAQYEIFPERSNSMYALRSRRPDVLVAAAITVQPGARPSRSFYHLTAHSEEKVGASASAALNPSPVSTKATLDLAVTKSSPPDSPPQQSLASSATNTTPTSSHTPTPGSPSSSVTSVSLPTKSPSNKVLASPAVSVGTIPTDTSEAAPRSGPAPLKKSWASLLRPVSLDTQGKVSSTQTSNGLPTSSVQGFSVSATPPASARPSGPSGVLVALLVPPHVLDGPVPPLRPRGLINLGNMCFANTVLQVLIFCPPFFHLFAELARTPRGEAVCLTPLVDATIALMKEFQVPNKPQEEEETGRDAFVPACVYDALKEKKRFDSMRGGQQEDAEEFLGFYLDTLEEELLSMVASITPPATPAPLEERVAKDVSVDGWLEVGKKNKPIVTRMHKSLESPISCIFGGRFRTALRVPGVGESLIVDPWSRLQLDIQPDYVHTIEDALRHGAAPGTVQVARPGSQVDASQQTLIDALPPVLVLHLKRFLYDTAVGDVVKLRKHVAFGTELDVPKEVMAPARRSRPYKYKLFGVLNHHGSSATGGHYTLDVLHPNEREGWLRIDDDVVQHVQEDLPARDAGDERTAYLLFYQRIATPGARM